MAKKKRKTTTRRRSTSSGSSAAPRRRRKISPTKYIPSAGATVGLALANKDIIQHIANNPFQLDTYKSAAQAAIQPNRLKQDAVNMVVGYGAGWAVKQFAPKMIKEPIGKIAKKIPRVI